MAEVPLNIKINDGGAGKTLEQLKNSASALRQEIEKVPLGSKKFNELKTALKQVDSEVQHLDDSLKGLNPEAKADAFLKTTEGIAGGFAVATGAMALFGTESEELEKTMLKVQSALAIAQGVKMVTEGLGKMGAAFNALKAIILANPILTIGLVLTTAVAGIVKFMSANDDLTESYEKQKKVIQERFDAVERGYDKEILLAKAAGKETTELERGKLQATITRIREELKLINQRYDLEMKRAKETAGAVGSAMTQVLTAENTEHKEQVKALEQSLDDAETSLLAFEIGVQKQISDTIEDSKKKNHDAYVDMLEKRKALIQKFNEDMKALDDFAKTEEETRRKETFSVIDLELEAHQEEIDQKQKMNQMLLDSEKAADAERAEMAAAEDKRKADQLKFEEYLANRRAELQKNLFSSLASLGQIFINNQEQMDKFQKGLAVSQIAIDTAKAISSGVAAAAPLTFPANLVAISATIATVLANIAQAKNILASAPGVQAPSLNTAGGNTSIPIPPPPSNIDNDSTRLNRERIENQGGSPIRVFVTETDISNTQNTVNTIRQRATIR